MKREAAIRVLGVEHFFGEGETKKQVLFNVNLEIAPGEIVIMTGPSGSGKTTLLTLMGALRSVQAGSLVVRGKELQGLSKLDQVQVRRGIGYIFQAHNLFESLTARQNVYLSLELGGVPAREMQAHADAILGRLGLGHRLDYKPDSLSGGQRQRVAIARALASHPKVILADEPTAALDKESGREVVNLLKERAKEDLATILIVTHDSRILDVADRIVNMVDGTVASNIAVGETEMICAFLKSCAPFAAMTPSELMNVAQKLMKEEFPAGATVVRQGDVGDKFYLVASGRLRVFVDQRGEPKKVADLKAGDFFGEAALLGDGFRTATVVTDEPVELYALGKDDFRAVMDRLPAFGEQVRAVAFMRS